MRKRQRKSLPLASVAVKKTCRGVEAASSDELEPRIEISAHIGKTFFSNTLEGIIITGENDEIIDVNPAFISITGFSKKNVAGKKPFFLYSSRHDPRFFETVRSELKRKGRWQGEILIRTKSGESRQIILTSIDCGDSGTRTRQCIHIINDVTRYIDKSARMRNQIYYDALTNLPNRLLLKDRLTFTLNRCKRNETLMALMLLDLNRFHFVNETMGFDAGDQLLRTIGRRLKSCVREMDSVFRLGNDEFALLVESVSHPADISRIANRILSACAKPFRLSNREVYAAISVGIGIFPDDGDTIDLLLKNAQAALARAKDYGINNFQHYQPHMNAKVIEEFTLENDLRKAISEHQFLLYFQPQIDLATREVTGAEALIRWRHPVLGMVSPLQFVHLAESNGLIIPIGEWVLKVACAQMKRWQRRYMKNFSIAVNLSHRQFQQQNFPSIVAKALKSAQLDPSALVLEITESMGMKNPESTLATLQELKAMGVRIAIDDFGTGYSSIHYLKKFPIDTIKIDRSFVADIATDQNDATIVLAMIALAQSLKLTVIAEGVENREQLDYLVQNGCRKIQGYIYSPPVEPEAFERLIEDPSGLEKLGL